MQRAQVKSHETGNIGEADYHNISSAPAFRAFFSFTRESRRMPRMKKKIRERIEFLDEPVKCRIMAKMNGPQTAENLLTTE